MKSIINIIVIVFIVNINSFAQNKKKSKIINLGISNGLLTNVNEKDAMAALKIWGAKVIKNENLIITDEPYMYYDVEQYVRDLKNKKIDLSIVNICHFYELLELSLIEPVLVSTTNGKAGPRFLLIANQDINNLSDLKNKKMIVSEGLLGTISKKWFYYTVTENNLDSNLYKNNFRYKPKTNKILLSVFFNKADACIITEQAFQQMIELNPQLKEKLNIIARSPILPYGVICFRKDLDIEIKKIIKQATLDLEKTISGKLILKLFKSDGVKPYDSLDFVEIKKICKENEIKNDKNAN